MSTWASLLSDPYFKIYVVARASKSIGQPTDVEIAALKNVNQALLSTTKWTLIILFLIHLTVNYSVAHKSITKRR